MKGSRRLEALELARQIVDLASDKQASDIILLDIREISLIADYFVICTAGSERQVTAIRDDVVEQIRTRHQLRPLRQEGNSGSGWLLLDYGDVVVHVFAPEERAFYRLEELWSEAPAVLRLQ